jgi:hypothetical protein
VARGQRVGSKGGLEEAELAGASYGRRPGGDAELAVDALEVTADGAGADVELYRNLPVGQAFGHKPQDLRLADAQEAPDGTAGRRLLRRVPEGLPRFREGLFRRKRSALLEGLGGRFFAQ